MPTAFQRNAFQNNAFQIRTRDIGGAIVAHMFSRRRYRKLNAELEAAIAGRALENSSARQRQRSKHRTESTHDRDADVRAYQPGRA
jgi:hypothetical protein